jgi:ADP-ribose pyrophosphatase YjhB (NUDIX family)
VLAIRRRDDGRWEPPGGVLEPHEAVHEGLVREVREETGLTVTPGPLTGVYKHLGRGVVALVFRCSAPDGAPQPTAEAAAVRWFQPAEVRTHLDEPFAVRLLDALAHGPPAVRAHDGTLVRRDRA